MRSKRITDDPLFDLILVLIKSRVLSRPVRCLKRKQRIIRGINDAAYTAKSLLRKQLLLNLTGINILNGQKALTQAMYSE